ncbi:MAG TPA: hypothetical protein VF746_21390 [Longimicrobium sp.]
MRSSLVRTAVTVFTLAAAAPAAAQVPLTPRSLGMGGAYVAVARGHEALFLNPANLGLPGTSHWSFGIPTLTLGYSLLGIGYGDARDLLGFDELDQAERDEILEKIPEPGTELRGDLRIPLVAAQIRRFAVGVSYGIIGSHTVDRDIVDLLLNGPILGRNDDVLPDETQGFRAEYVDFALAHGRRFGPVSVGATAHWYLGNTLLRAGITSVQVVTAPQPDVLVTYSGVKSEGGSGFGLDLGLAAEPAPGVTVSASLGNVVNTFEWDDALRRRRLVLDRTDYQSGDPDALLGEYEASETDYDPATSTAAEQALAADLEEGTELPRTLRVGAAWRPAALRNAVFAAAYQGNLEDSRVGGMWDRSLSVGWQQQFTRMVGLRAGVASNLDDGGLLGAGVSFGPVHLGVARLSDGSVDGKGRDGWTFTFGLGTRSNSTMP